MKALCILLVDDDRLFWELCEAALQDSQEFDRGVKLVCLPDGREVMPYLRGDGTYADRDQYPAPDLILLDQRMPRMDGTQVLRQLRGADSPRDTIPVCLFSTSAQDKLLTEAYREGANFCFRKPLDFDDLRVRLLQIAEFFRTVVELPRRAKT